MNAPVPGLKPTSYIGQDVPRPNAKRLLTDVAGGFEARHGGVHAASTI